MLRTHSILPSAVAIGSNETFYRGRAWREQQQPHREVHEGWKFIKCGERRAPARGVRHTALSGLRFERTAVSSGIAITIASRSSTRKETNRGVEAIQPAERNFH